MPHLGPSLDQPVPLSKLLAVGLERNPDEAALLARKGEASWSELETVRMGSPKTTSRLASSPEIGSPR